MMLRAIVVIIPLYLVFFSCSSTKHAFKKGDISHASKLYGLSFNEQSIDTMYAYLERNKKGYDSLRAYPIPDSVLPSLLFNPFPYSFEKPNGDDCRSPLMIRNIEMPPDNELAFLNISEQANLIKSGRLSSEHLTQVYIDRIKKYDGTLQSVIHLLEKEAIEKARIADQEIQNGNYIGPLHGIPYGIKDLFSYPGYPTTWGAKPYKDQILNEKASVIKKLEDAGAILIAKLSSGALARGDVWYGGRTMNPWDTLQGASGSSAGSGSATAAGLVSFSIGTETLGSITSPCNRNGITGLRPTYGRVSRKGVMPLSWSMDKVGPMCRTAEDCLLVFERILGSDGSDPTVYDIPFCYSDKVKKDVSEYKVAYLKNLFDKDTSDANEQAKLALFDFRDLGIELIEDSLPSSFPFNAFDIILRSEAGAFFDDLVRSGGVDMMVEQTQRSRANSLRQSRFIPAVEYIQANRQRTMLIEELHKVISKYDAIITPTFGGTQLVTTNLTGHPVITIPTGLDCDGSPTSISILGNLFDESTLLNLAIKFQEVTIYEEEHPPLFSK